MESATGLLFSLWLLIFILTSSHLQRLNHKHFNECTWAIFLGLTLGFLFYAFGDNALHRTSRTSIFLDLILPILVMGAAREVDLKMMAANSGYIVLYGFVGTFLNFVGLFCFIILFSETFSLRLLNHSNRFLTSADAQRNSHSHGHHIRASPG